MLVPSIAMGVDMPDLVRERVEVVLLDGPDVILVENTFDNNHVIFLPGGGLDGDTLNEAAVKEVAEEVGFHCKPSTILGIVYNEAPHGSGYKKWRAEYYSSIRTSFVIAKVIARDTSLLGADGDAEKFIKIHIGDLVRNLVNPPDNSSWPVNRLEVIRSVIDIEGFTI